ncbi:MAG: ATP-binding protein [Candidatus Thermoplasmatota archaeon]|nr:ATP-binding protein [Candidatus Thermoplasmatota archaeon]
MKQEVRGVRDSESEIGYVVGDNSSDFFRFVMPEDLELRKWDYVYVMAGDRKIVGRIEKVLASSELLSDDLDFRSIGKYVESSINYFVSICVARVIGEYSDKHIKTSRILIKPGNRVYIAPVDMMENMFSFPEEESLSIGELTDRENVSVSVSVKGMMRHVAILAQTGAGKSHTAGVLMEELLKKGASIIVIDPHADYVLMRQAQEGGFYSSSIRTFRTPLSTGRYAQGNGIVRSFTLRFSDLDSEDISEIMGIKESWTNLRKSVEETLSKMHGSRDFDDFMKTASELPAEDYHRITGRLRLLGKVRSIFSENTTGIGDYLSPGKMSILDLSGMDQFLANYFSYRVLKETYEAKVNGTYRFPVFVFIEEAHNFVPPLSGTLISQMIKKIASEGRKFGIFLVVITQRPCKIDQDVLSQCNSQIILRITNPLDQKAVVESGESVSQSIIDDLPSLNVGEAILVGQFVRMPVSVRIRERESREGGGDIDILGLLKEAREESESSSNPSKIKANIGKFLEG